MVTISEIMCSSVRVIEQTDSVLNAAKEMSKNGISCLVVVSKGKTVGMITRRDIIEKLIVHKRNVQTTRVKTIMSKPIIAVKPEASIRFALRVMRSKKIKQLPVIEDEHVVGIVTQTDIANAS